MERRKTILLVEDESIIAISEAMTIRSFGYDVVVANSGEKAVESAAGDKGIDLVLMDINLGDGIDGLEAARRILGARNIPIVFLTANSGKACVDGVKEITRYGYVLKNTSDFALRSSIEMAFELFEANEKIRIEMDALRESKETAERYLDVAAAIIVSIDRSGNIILASDSGCKLLGYDRGELIGKNWFDTCVPERDRERIREGFRKTMSGESASAESIENPIVAKDGSERTILWHNTACKDAAGRIVGALSSGEDITERKDARERLKKSEERFREIIERMIDYIYTVYYENGKIVKTVHNPACIAVTGYSAEEFEGDQYLWFRMIVPEDRDRVTKYTERIPYEAAPASIEHRIRRKDGTLRWIRNTPVPHFDSQGILVSRDGIVVDITERKLAEERVRNLLQEKEILLKEVHHRIRNNMASLASLLSLQADSAGDAKIGEALHAARGRVQSMQVLYDKLYLHGNCRFVLAREYFADLISDIKSALCASSDIALELRVDDVLLDAEYLFSLGILANELITNALKHAFPQGRAGTIRVDFSAGPGAECVLSVADNGIGLPENARAGNSSGLGLALIDALTEQLHGSIEIVRKAGTNFRIRFSVKEDARVSAN
jgi:PAS domain S-box-containing protein